MAEELELKEKTIKSELIFRGRVVNLRVDTVELPTGRRSTREIVEHLGAVAVVPITDKGEVILIKQFRQPTGEVLLEIPAGTLQSGEKPELCARRELIEEIGYRAGKLEHMFSSYLAPGYSTENLHTYLATNLVKKKQAPDVDECIEIEILGLEEAVKLIEEGKIKDAKSICGILMAARRLGK